MEIAEFSAVDLAEIYRDLVNHRASVDRPYIVINMISSVDGKATIGTKASLLGSKVDRQMMRQVRASFDALAYGVGTLRLEQVDPLVPDDLSQWRVSRRLAPQPRRVSFSSSGRVPLENRFFTTKGEPPVVFLSESASDEALAKMRADLRIFKVGQSAVDLVEAARILRRQLAVTSMLLEGGPALNYSFLGAGLVDEVLLTLAPKIVAGLPPTTIVEGEPLPPPGLRLSLISVYRHESELFLRYRIVRH